MQSHTEELIKILTHWEQKKPEQKKKGLVLNKSKVEKTKSKCVLTISFEIILFRGKNDKTMNLGSSKSIIVLLSFSKEPLFDLT